MPPKHLGVLRLNDRRQSKRAHGDVLGQAVGTVLEQAKACSTASLCLGCLGKARSPQASKQRPNPAIAWIFSILAAAVKGAHPVQSQLATLDREAGGKRSAPPRNDALYARRRAPTRARDSRPTPGTEIGSPHGLACASFRCRRGSPVPRVRDHSSPSCCGIDSLPVAELIAAQAPVHCTRVKRHGHAGRTDAISDGR